MAVIGCGKDAERKYAAYNVISVTAADGLGYNLRYLAPPWRTVDDDPRVLGTTKTVRIGAEASEGGTGRDIAFEPGTARALEIQRESVAPDNAPDGAVGVVTHAKYDLLTALIRCSAGQVAAQDSCAASLATEDSLGRATAEEVGFEGSMRHQGVNDFGQTYYDFMTLTRTDNRYRRIVYYETADRLSAVRLFIEANPGLGDDETNHMVNAFEALSGQVSGTTGDGGVDAGAAKAGP